MWQGACDTGDQLLGESEGGYTPLWCELLARELAVRSAEGGGGILARSEVFNATILPVGVE